MRVRGRSLLATSCSPLSLDVLTAAAGAEAWIAQLDRLMDITDAQPDLGITWTRSGIEGVNHGRVIGHTCSGLYAPFQAILASP